MRKGKENQTTTTSSGNYVYMDENNQNILSDYTRSYPYMGTPVTTTNNIYEKDNIDIVLIAVSTLIIISSFTYLIFV